MPDTRSDQPQPEALIAYGGGPPGTRASETTAEEVPLQLWLPQIPLAAVLAQAEALANAREEERRLAPQLLANLAPLPESRAALLIDNHRDYQTWGFAEALIEQSRAGIFAAEPPQAVHFARLATRVAERLDESWYGRALANDLRCQTWAALGNALRSAGEFDDAQAAFEVAGSFLGEGSGDPLEEGNLLSLRASLETERGEYDASIELLDQAIRIYREVEDDYLLGRTLIKKAMPAGFKDPKDALILVDEALQYVSPDEDPRLFLCARHIQIAFLDDAGCSEEAAQLLAASRHLFRKVGGDWFNIRLAWVEARILISLGQLQEADAALEVVFEEVRCRDLRHESVLVTLDLAVCRLAQGRHREASELAASMAHQLRQWGVHRRAQDAWALVQKALADEKASMKLLRDVALYLTRAWRNPNLDFQRAE